MQHLDVIAMMIAAIGIFMLGLGFLIWKLDLALTNRWNRMQARNIAIWRILRAGWR